VLQDLRYAFRTFRRSPLVAAVAVITLGLGIGGATAVFGVVDAVLLRPLPFEAPGRLVRISEITPDGADFSFSAGNFLDLQARSRTLAAVAAFRETGTMVLTDSGTPYRLATVPISSSAADVLQVRPALGRMFRPDDDRPQSAARPVVLSDGLWRQRYGADPAMIGKIIRLDGQPFAVTGIMPPGFDFPQGTEAWVPLRPDPAFDRDDKDLAVVGRLAPGATLAQARGELREFGRRLSVEHPKSNAGWSVGAVSFDDWLVASSARDAVWMLFGAVGVLLLLACANVANLLLARAAARQGEMRLRAALGAGRLRLARQLFTESVLLAALGTLVGVIVAFWSTAGVHALGDGRVPRLEQVQIDATVLGFACLAGTLSCLVFGLAPALQGARVDLRAATHEGVRYSAAGRRLRRALVVAEVGLALLLLVGAGLLANSFVRLVRADTGFDASGVIAMSLDVSPARYPDQRLAAFYAEVLARVRALPGVTIAGATSTNPFRQSGFANNVTPEDRAADAPPSGLVQAGWRSVTPGFLEAMRIPVLRGRAFEAADRDGAERVVMVSRSLAAQLWPGTDAVGRRIYWGGTTGRTRTVIGVTGDFQDVRLGAEPMPMLLVPHAQVDVPAMTVVIRTPLDIARLAPSLRETLAELDAALPPPAVQAVGASRTEAAAGPRFNLWLLGAFAGIALLLAVTGVYAMLAFSIIERRREIAVRLALGASRREIVRLLVGGGLALAAAGVAIGTVAALGLTQLISTLLYDVQPTDPWTFAAAAAVLLVSAGAASYLPARRAGRLDPLAVLRD
jgi:predicted permease